MWIASFQGSVFFFVADMEDEEEEENDGIPLWKKALMKKRAAEQKKKEQETKKKVWESWQLLLLCILELYRRTQFLALIATYNCYYSWFSYKLQLG